MAEISADLIYEVLKALQRDVSQVRSELGEIKSELGAIRGHQLSIQHDVHNIYGVLGRHDLWFERIERRLELNDAPNLGRVMAAMGEVSQQQVLDLSHEIADDVGDLRAGRQSCPS